MKTTDFQIMSSFVVFLCLLLIRSCKAEDPNPKAWPEQFHALTFQTRSERKSLVDLWYDWPNGRNMNIVKKQLGSQVYDVEWNNGTSFYFDLEAKSCFTIHFEVGILRPEWLDNAHYMGVEELDGFSCNVWEKADFIVYYEDVETKRPVGWNFTGSDMFLHVMTFEEGATLPDKFWQTPSYCFPDAAGDKSDLEIPLLTHVSPTHHTWREV